MPFDPFDCDPAFRPIRPRVPWTFWMFALVVIACCFVAATVRPQEPEPLVLHVFCLPDSQCPPCARFHADASQSPLKETLAGWTVHHHSQFDGPDWSVDRYPTFVLARGRSQVRTMVGYTQPGNLIRWLGEGK